MWWVLLTLLISLHMYIYTAGEVLDITDQQNHVAAAFPTNWHQLMSQWNWPLYSVNASQMRKLCQHRCYMHVSCQPNQKQQNLPNRWHAEKLVICKCQEKCKTKHCPYKKADGDFVIYCLKEQCVKISSRPIRSVTSWIAQISHRTITKFWLFIGCLDRIWQFG